MSVSLTRPAQPLPALPQEALDTGSLKDFWVSPVCVSPGRQPAVCFLRKACHKPSKGRLPLYFVELT